jgi:hypothetical protein
LSDIDVAYNQLMSKINNRVQTDGSQSGPQPGTPTAQAQLSSSPSSLLYGSPNVSSSLMQTALNYQAIMNGAGFSFNGIS